MNDRVCLLLSTRPALEPRPQVRPGVVLRGSGGRTRGARGGGPVSCVLRAKSYEARARGAAGAAGYTVQVPAELG